MIKTYRELTLEERKQTYRNYINALDFDTAYLIDDSFEAYNEENERLDMDFDSITLECLG